MSMLRSGHAAGLAAAAAALMVACGGGDNAGERAENAAVHTESAATANLGDTMPIGRTTVQLSVLSSDPQWVSGGDARIHVRAPRGLRDKLELSLNGRRVQRRARRSRRRPRGGGQRPAARRQPARGQAPPRPRARCDHADQLADHRADVHRAAADAVCLHRDAVQSAAQRRQPGGAGLPGDGRAGTDDRLQPQLLDRHLRHLPLSSHQQHLEAAAGRVRGPPT